MEGGLDNLIVLKGKERIELAPLKISIMDGPSGNKQTQAKERYAISEGPEQARLVSVADCPLCAPPHKKRGLLLPVLPSPRGNGKANADLVCVFVFCYSKFLLLAFSV